MESSSNFDKLLMWTCTNEQYFAIVYRASYLIALAIHIYIYTYTIFLFAGNKGCC